MSKPKPNIKLFFREKTRFLKENQWSPGLILLTLIAFTLDAIGFSIMFEENHLHGNWWDFIYYSIRVFGFDLQTPALDTPIPWELELGRWLSGIVTIWAVMFLISRAFIDWINLSLKGRDHVVIIGAGNKGKSLGLDWMRIAEQPSSEFHKTLFVFIEMNKNNPHIELLKSKGAVVILGDAKDEEILKKARISCAKQVVLVTDSDATNIEIVSTITHLQQERGSNRHQLSCYVHLIHNEFYDFFMAKDFKPTQNMNIKIFNIHTNSARILFSDPPNLLGSRVFTDAQKIKDKNTTVKIAIFGFGEIGESILIHALHLGHFYNENPIEITVVYDMDDVKNANLLDEFIKHYNIGMKKGERKNTSLNEYWNIGFMDDGDFIKRGIEEYTQVIIAYEDEFESLSNLMKLLKRYNDEIISKQIDIAIYSNSFAHTAAIMESDKDPEKNTIFQQVRTFGQLDKTCSYAVVINEELDEKAKANNQNYNDLHGYSGNQTKEEQWNHLSLFLKDSNRYLMEHNEIKKYSIHHLIHASQTTHDYETLKNAIAEHYFNYDGMKINWDQMGLNYHDYALKLSEEEIVQLGKVEHKRWNAFHILNGWKVMPLEQLQAKTQNLHGHKEKDGQQKDKFKKLHACLVSWEELDQVSAAVEHNYKSDDIETIMRIPSLEQQCLQIKK